MYILKSKYQDILVSDYKLEFKDYLLEVANKEIAEDIASRGYAEIISAPEEKESKKKKEI